MRSKWWTLELGFVMGGVLAVATNAPLRGRPTMPVRVAGGTGNPSASIPPGGVFRAARRPIVDETGLAGRYDFKIHYLWIHRPGTNGDAADSGPSLFTAVQEQLGLKLEPSTSSFPQLVIESIDRDPTDN